MDNEKNSEDISQKQFEFSIGDIIKKISDVKESDFRKSVSAIKKDRQAENEQNIERD